MQPLTFTQKLLRQRRFLSSLIPLFALFVGLSASQTVLAQTAITANTVTLNVRGTNSTYDTQSTTPGPGVFQGANFSTFDLATPTDVFTLNGATLTINDPTGNFNSAVLRYRIYQTGNTPSGLIDVALGSGTLSGGVRTFTVSGQNRNLLASLTGGASTNYTFDLFFRADDNNVTFGNINNAPPRSATFTVTGAPIPPTSLSNTTVIVNPNNVTNGNVTYNASAPGTPMFNMSNLGTFDINNGQLILKGGTATTFESGGDAVLNTILNFRVFKNGSNPGTFTSFPLQQISLNSGTRQFSVTNEQRNLIANLANAGIGSFFVQVFFTSDVRRANGSFETLIDNNGGANYTATFSTTGTPIQTVTWNGNNDDNWFNTSNWDLNRIPDAMTNVVIPNFATGNGSPYPNIFSDQSYLNTPNPTVSTTRVTVNNANSGPALARNLSLLGESSTIDRSILRLQPNSVLKIYGDFSNRFLSYITRDNSNTWFASANPQNIGQANYATLTVSGGGTKAVTGIANVGEQLVFDSSMGNTIVTTDSQNPGGSFIQMADRLAVNSTQGAQIVGETDNSYVFGLIQTRRANVLANEGAPRTLGGLGFTFEFLGSSDPGDINITRSTVQNYFFSGTRISVRRVFGIQPSNLGKAGFNLLANVTFSVLPNETKNLSPTNTATIPEQNLVLFLSKNNGDTFGSLGRDGAVVNYTVSKNNVTDFATFTLGDRDNPLPVRLTAFDAKRLGNDALVTWQTASEENSKGYEVQVSTNGTEYRTLTSVPSASPNTTQVTNYSYVDKEANKTGKRYYRLHQLDLDGKDAFFAPTVVSFDGKAPASNFVAYPNPLNAGNELHVALQSAATGTAKLLVTDMMGRTLQQQNVVLTGGLTDASVAGMGDLKAGMYLVKITLPSGEVKNLKVVKQ
ncbi:T9SS type A sorting domain-containing protein [Hymenobacter siberiensis]|uniref:T9SS type A sorting domain-containing protein n=1 Tax=Hymenobacter siberiensis TaxID=2848396 RepID=UPI001C1E58B7|nr:T9SS type A sorting domain-containing protein [Hymenobacter siberiensis]MBU6120025.1 T9SS type A sorting domain-containing protein [Hymenobacter siberiensis]